MNLEKLLQKANSISGIRRLNMQFKKERRLLPCFHKRAAKGPSLIRDSYWSFCEGFVETIDFKRNENLKAIDGRDLVSLQEDLKDIDYDMHCAVGLGKRMKVPEISF